jgi:preprotein translocase subunit SecA
VIATQRGSARRIDRQLFGRCARQGEPGSYELLVSLDDTPVRDAIPAWLVRASAQALRRGVALSRLLARYLTSRAQKAEEKRSARMRAAVAALDEMRDRLLAFSGRGE